MRILELLRIDHHGICAGDSTISWPGGIPIPDGYRIVRSYTEHGDEVNKEVDGSEPGDISDERLNG